MTSLPPSFSEGLDPPLKIDEKVIATLWETRLVALVTG